MAKVKIDRDEFYPYPILHDLTHYGTEVEVEAATLRRWKRVIAEFRAVATEIFDVVEKVEKR